MTDNDKDDSRDDVDWLKDAFDRALQGDNGTAPDAARPAVNPFAGLAPTGDTAPIEPAIPAEPGVPTEMPSQRHDLDLDFETDNMPPVGAFEPVVPLDRPLPSVATDYPPTEAIDAVDLPTTVEPVVPTVPTPQPSTTPVMSDETSGIDRLDALFSSPDTSAATVPLVTTPMTSAADPSVSARGTDPVNQAKFRQRLIMIGIGIVIVIVSIGAFFVGGIAGTPAAPPTPEPTEAPAAPTATRTPGEYAFAELFGGECIDPFDTAWASTFTVVDCAAPHSAQLVYAGDLAVDETYMSYPGDARIGKVAMAACSRKGVLNLTTAKAYSDVLVSSAYPVSSEAWDSGDTRYYCFVSLSSGSAIEGDLAGKLITQNVEPTPEPTATP